LILQNPYGGFSADGTEYVIKLEPGHTTPAPWANVLANPGFGTVVSESGGAYTWSENAHEFRLTPWANDPVGDTSGEAIYLRDEESGHYWSPTPLPRRGSGTYTTRHGFGYSVFEHEEDGICSELWVYVALHAPVKFSVLKIRNVSGRARQLSATGYVEWTLGDLREKSAMHIVTEADPLSGALFARNDYSMEFGGRVAFFAVDDTVASFTCDRREFIGRNGSLRAPAAMRQARLSGHAGAGLDPCAALKADFDLADGDSREIVFRMGAAHDALSVRGIAKEFRGAVAAANALDAVRKHWQATLGRVQVRTPEPAVDVLVNGWLMYQVIACRTQRLLPVRRRVWLQGSVAGFHGDDPRHAAACPRASLAVRSAPVSRGRRAALVASAAWPRRTYRLLRRLPVARRGNQPLREHYRRHERA